MYVRTHVIASMCTVLVDDMQGLVWGEPELAHEYDFDVENIIMKNRRFEVCNMEECNFLVICSLSFR